MTETQIVERLAKRLGWTLEPMKIGFRTTSPSGAIFYSRESHEWLPENLLTSHDALRPVLATLTEIERATLDDILRREYGEANINTVTSVDGLRWFLLTLDPAVLARAVAEAIGGDK